ncbi:MAG: hypothetical protein A3G34_07310 [Candidatus Lindowbacteria bacterium RIFCSPLOWO2_12_FULL_62_27]|nr:MAG: hypothetical protein A3I06_04475 [Candidatus Lindowbacteria bacterium RIFCSPLOWO2_02_FULL_62_12]OGH59620.1 MAG: hypothetical protein A3G34_07310 [Candidatus Lindowbacteria bacterium RIFCSPLOWO2_12_FULL_62_27]
MKLRQFFLVLLCLFGLADVLFLSAQEDKGTIGQFCESLAGSFGAGCEKVLSSRFSTVAGFPLSQWGMVYYLTMLWLSIWVRVESDRGGGRAAGVLLAILSGTGLGVSVYLTYLQAGPLGAWCPFCLMSAAITLLIAVLSVWGACRSIFGGGPSNGAPAEVLPLSRSGATAVAALSLLSILMASGLAVALLSRRPEKASSALEDMMRYVPRRVTPPGGQAYGLDTAPVAVQAFLDYTCQHCRSFEADVFPRIRREYIDPGRVRWISKVLPHSDQGAPMFFSMAGICARSTKDSGAIERAFFSYPMPSPKTGFDALVDAVQKVGLDTQVAAGLRTCMETRYRDVQQQVIVEVQQAFSYGLKGPPAFVIDGIAFQGSMEYRTLSDLLELFLTQHQP